MNGSDLEVLRQGNCLGRAFLKHWDGISRSQLEKREGIGSATVERWFQDFLQRELAERQGAPCPQVLGIEGTIVKLLDQVW